MGSPKKNEGKGFFAAMSSGLSMFGSAMHRSVNGLLGYEGVEVINPEGGKEDAEEEAQRGRWKQEERDSYWKMMHKYIGSDVTSMVTLPVLIFEPMTMLQKMAELMEYCHLLDQADDCEDPYLRLVYASSWAVSVYYAYQRTWKPFNPILGETYEMANHGGVMFIAEQVSHHPPMSSGHAENEHFTYDVTSKLKTKFLGNSLDVYPVGRTRVTLKKDGVLLDLVPPPTKVNNLIFGRTWVDSPGEMIMTNLTTGDKVVLYFQPCGWFGAGRFEVDGYVYNANEEPKILMTGKWNDSISYQPCDMEGEPLPGTEMKEVWHVTGTPKNDKYQYTHFAHKINSFNTAPKKLLASDSRLRPDRYSLEMGDLSKAGAEKSSLEERQRSVSMMATHHTSLLPEIGPDGLSREAPVIAYTEKIIEEERLQLTKYIEENYSKIRDVERELGNLTLEMKLTAGPKKAALEHMRKKIEMSTERIRIAKINEEQARKVLEAASKAVKDEEEIKKKLCEDLNHLVQESSNFQFSRLEELKRRLEALNPTRASTSVLQELVPAQSGAVLEASIVPRTTEPAGGGAERVPHQGNSANGPVTNGHGQQHSVEGEGRGKKKGLIQGRGKGIGAVPKGRGSAAPGWTGAGFDIDGKN